MCNSLLYFFVDVNSKITDNFTAGMYRISSLSINEHMNSVMRGGANTLRRYLLMDRLGITNDDMYIMYYL